MLHSFQITIWQHFLLIAQSAVMPAVMTLCHFFFQREIYQFGMKGLISLHLCISPGSDIRAESDLYVSQALKLLRQSGIKLNSAGSSGNVSTLSEKQYGNSLDQCWWSPFSLNALQQWISGAIWNKPRLWWERRQKTSHKTCSWTYALSRILLIWQIDLLELHPIPAIAAHDAHTWKPY